MLEKIMKLIESTEGLEVQFKVGKESELIIKGDFLKMAKIFADLQVASDKQSDRNYKITELERELEELKRERA